MWTGRSVCSTRSYAWGIGGELLQRGRVAAEKERRAIQKHDERQAKMQRIRKRAEVISNPHSAARSAAIPHARAATQ